MDEVNVCGSVFCENSDDMKVSITIAIIITTFMAHQNITEKMA